LIGSAVSNAAIIVNIGVLRIDFDCLGEIRDGAIIVAFGAERAAAVGVRTRIGRVDFDRL
jgi:hypothetical protein